MFCCERWKCQSFYQLAMKLNSPILIPRWGLRCKSIYESSYCSNWKLCWHLAPKLFFTFKLSWFVSQLFCRLYHCIVHRRWLFQLLFWNLWYCCGKRIINNYNKSRHMSMNQFINWSFNELIFHWAVEKLNFYWFWLWTWS